MNCDCKCDKSCDFGEHLDYENCKCRKKLVDKLIEECSENIDKNEMIYNGTLNNYESVYNSCTICIVFLVIYFHRYLIRSDAGITNINGNTETVIY